MIVIDARDCPEELADAWLETYSDYHAQVAEARARAWGWVRSLVLLLAAAVGIVAAILAAGCEVQP